MESESFDSRVVFGETFGRERYRINDERGKTRRSRFKESVGGRNPKCMLPKTRHGQKRKSHGAGNRIYRVLRSCIMIPGEFTAGSRAHTREKSMKRILEETFGPRIRSDFHRGQTGSSAFQDIFPGQTSTTYFRRRSIDKILQLSKICTETKQNWGF